VGRKGFVIKASGGEHKAAISTFAEALYIVRRYYNKPPHKGDVSIEINGREIYHYNRITEKEIINMSVFSTFREELKNSGQELDKVPSLKEVDRLLLIRSGVPFTISSAESVAGQYGTQICYQVDIATTSPAYESLSKTVQLSPEYVLWTKATTNRVKQLALLKPYIDQKTPLIMVGATGKDWDFDVVPQKGA
jgi:hypothetical protein